MTDRACFILTRFNVPIGNVPVNLGLTDAWLDHRFALFENFCLPSVVAQDYKDFHWLVLIDERTPEKWRARLQDDLLPLPRARIVPVSQESEAVYVREILSLVAGTQVRQIVTTRLDNDDAIASDYLAEVVRCAGSLRQRDRHYVINFRAGCQASHLGVFAVSERLNPFLSVVSPARPLRTAVHAEHAGMDRCGKVIDHAGSPGGSPRWLQTIHGNNIANRLQHKRVRIEPGRLEGFALGPRWRQLLEPAHFSFPDRAVGVLRFSHRQSALPGTPARSQVFELALRGWEGDHVFERMRGARGFHESDLLQFLGFLLGPDPGVVVDANANIGADAVFFAKVLGAEVVCVEPNPAAAGLLTANLALNEVSGRVRIVAAAPSDRRGTARLAATSLLNLGAAKLIEEHEPRRGDVFLAPLDEIITSAEAGRVTLVKAADPEGDGRVVQGMSRLLQSRRPILVIETGTEALPRIESVLRPLGYVQAGPFCAAPTYVFCPGRLRLWRARLQRRLVRSAARLRRKLWP